jgi:glutamate 5-kinase
MHGMKNEAEILRMCTVGKRVVVMSSGKELGGIEIFGIKSKNYRASLN